jgi:Fur family transcriptional regulator, peroxide stress response regulator
MAHMRSIGHATNLELLSALQKTYPSLSATTVHRITTRLVQRGELQLAPATPDGAMRFDSNLTAHDHFLCRRCGILKDTVILPRVLATIEQQFDDCHISGPVTITGLCKQCK